MKKLKGIFIALALSAVTLSSCGVAGKTEQKPEEKTATAQKVETTTPTVIKLGINGDEGPIWNDVKTRLAKENITLEIVSFSDYILPNTALVDGEIDANAFQTEIFFNDFLEQSKAELSILNYTILAPMGIYAGTSKTLEEIPTGGKIAIPNDRSNGGRALLLLQEAGIIELDPVNGLFPTVKDVVKNEKNIELIELAPAQIALSLDELSVGVINNGFAISAGFKPNTDSIFIESVEMKNAPNYYNIIAVQTKDLERPEILKLKEVYLSEETKKSIEEQYKGSAVPAF